MNRAPKARNGFTLVEVLTALVITGVVALLAHQLVGVCVDSVHALARNRSAEDRTENARRWLRAAFLSLEAGGGWGAFEGLADQVSFTTWLEQPGGWFSPTRVTLRAMDGTLEARGGRGAAIALADSVTDLGIDYLLETGANTRWARGWLSPISAPLAVRFRITRQNSGREIVDTLLCLIKERG